MFGIRITHVCAWIMAGAMACLALTASAANVDYSLNKANLPAPIVLRLKTFDGAESLIQVEPTSWFTNGENGGSNGNKTIDAGRLYLLVVDPGLVSAKYGLYPIDTFPAVSLNRSANAYDRLSVANHDGQEFGSHVRIGLAFCPADLANPKRSDCLHVRQAKFSVVSAEGAVKEFKCRAGACIFGDFLDQVQAPKGHDSVTTLLPVDQNLAIQKIDNSKLLYRLAAQEKADAADSARRAEAARADAERKAA